VGAVTARDVLALLERREAQVVAGASGLRRPITWVVAMRPRPPAFEALDGGELALLSLATLRTLHAQDDSLTLARLIQDLAERRVAMIAVVGLLPPGVATATSSSTQSARATTDEEAELAAALGLPLVALPPGTSLAEVERDVLTAVRRASAEREAQDDFPRASYDALLRASLRGEDDRALGGRLAGLLDVAVALEGADGVEWCALPQGFALGREALVALLARPSARAALRASAAESRPGEPMPVGRDLSRLVVRLDVAATRPADGDVERNAVVDLGEGMLAHAGTAPDASTYLGLIFPSSSGDRVTGLASVLEMVGPLFALALARRRDLAGVERRLRTEALDALLAGAYGDPAQMARRAAELGHDLSRPHAALVVDLDAGPADERVVKAALGDEVPRAWVRAHSGEVAALLPLDEGADGTALAALASRLEERLARAMGAAAWSAGLGRPLTGASEARRSYGEARDAARLGRLVLGPGRVARPADLGVYRLLLQLRASGELDEFTRTTLGPLLAEVRSSQALMETLEVFFACNGNLSEAARRLHLHRNSLIYRLNRARELLGHDLEDPELRLSLQLALKARRVLDL
jgi:purine catabolism regulator